MKTGKTALPNFHWIIEGLLAGMALPGLSFSEPMKDLEDLRRLGFSMLVTLTEDSMPFDLIVRSGLIPYHIPIPDFEAPNFGQAEDFCRIVDRMESEGKMVAVHCYAGLGRTGTMAAAYLIHRNGIEADEAMRRVQEINSGYIQSNVQETFLYEWADNLKRKK